MNNVQDQTTSNSADVVQRIQQHAATPEPQQQKKNSQILNRSSCDTDDIKNIRLKQEQYDQGNSQHEQAELAQIAQTIHLNKFMINQYLSIVSEHMQEFKNQMNFEVANEIKNNYLQGQALHEEREQEELKSLTLNQQITMEQNHLQEWQEAMKYWQNMENQQNIKEFNLIQQLNKQQEEDLINYKELLQQTISLQPKETSELINLKKMMVGLSRMNDYWKANQIQKSYIRLASEEQQKWLQVRDSKIDNLISQFKQNQQNDFNAQMKKLQAEKQHQMKIKDLEFKRISSKYQGQNRDLDTQIKNNMNKFNKLYYGKVICNLKQFEQESPSTKSKTQRNFYIKQHNKILQPNLPQQLQQQYQQGFISGNGQQEF